jgi:hypothetical protein
MGCAPGFAPGYFPRFCVLGGNIKLTHYPPPAGLASPPAGC